MTFGVGVTAGAAAYAVISAGVLSGTTHTLVSSVGGLFRVPSAAAEGLPAFDSCEQLRHWYVDRALPQVGPWGLSGPPIMYADTMRAAGGVLPQAADAAGSATGSATGPAVGSSDTGTNVQEAGVDESDVAKTDGRIVVQVLGQELVVTDVSGHRPHELSRTRIPGPALAQPELLLGGGRVLVVGAESMGYRGGPMPLGGRVVGPDPGAGNRTRLVTFDVSDPAHPAVTEQERVDGTVVSSREYAGHTARVVVTDGYPPLDFVTPNRDRTARQATAQNRKIVRSAPISKWLPSIDAGSGTKPLLDCSAVRHPRTPSGFGTISVLTFGLDDPAGYRATAVTASGDLVYSSLDRLYVATTSQRWQGPVPMPAATGDTAGVPQVSPRPGRVTTQVHAFALAGDRTSYVASGTVRGRVADRWSLSEQDGHLRVATGLGAGVVDGENAVDNAVTVLDEVGGRLEQVGRVDGLGRGQDIEAVRWFGDLAVVVTFRRMDPLYTLDLSDPAHPKVVGTLEIPGYSAYLHPLGDGQLVGLGHDATPSGQDLGAQAATFDLRDPRHVSRTDRLSFGAGTDVDAGADPRTFSYVPERRVLVTPVVSWAHGTTDFVALHVGTEGTLTRVGSWVTRRYDGGTVRTLPLGGGRVALVGDVVRLVDVR